jgi:hypothetical protein
VRQPPELTASTVCLSRRTRGTDLSRTGTPKLPALHDYQIPCTPSEAPPASIAPRRSGVCKIPPYFHDGSAATLEDVVEHYDVALELRIGDEDRADLVQYLRSL